MASEAPIQLSFLGGASAIGASSALIQVADTSLLIDCGVRFKSGNALPDLDQLTGKSLDAIVVTHAHSDHTGALPVVHEAYPGVPMYMTPPTQELVSILQRDALKIMDQEGDVPLYSERQIDSMISVIRPVQHGDRTQVRNIDMVFLPASHILGASMVYLATPAGNILFTGDYSVGAQRTVPALDRPHLPVDMIVTETTYGNRLHSDRKTAENLLINRVTQVLETGGRVLIPAFAIGRAQEVLLILKQALRNKRMPACPIFVDGMVRAVCNVYGRHERYVTRSLLRDISRSGHPFFSEPIVPVSHPDARQDVLAAGACVIVASSGMLAGGPSVFYASELAGCETDAILITGYQDEESPGRALLNLTEQTGPRQLRLGDKTVEVRCNFETYSLSAHADRMQMVGLIEAVKPRTVILVHGDADAKKALAASLSCRDIVHGEEGVQITRRYPRRKDSLLDRRPEDVLIAPEAAAALIGPATGASLRADHLSEAWFGKRVGRATRGRFVQQLEQAGLIRRDDHRRFILWPLTASAGPSEPTPEELELAEALKRENPKGKLLEFCMRRKLEKPETLETPDEDGCFVVELQVEIDGKLVASGRQRAFAKKVAEQLAAKALLGSISEQEETLEAMTVTEAQREYLEQQNLKGKLLELCMQLKLPMPQLKAEAVVGGYRCVATIHLSEATRLHTKPFLAARAKVAEQAASAELYDKLRFWLKSRPVEPAVSGPDQTGPQTDFHAKEPAPTRSQDPRVLLNEWRQKRSIVNFGYELVEHLGPSHQPVFVMTAWAELPSGERRTTDRVEAGSKKEAQLAAAADLLASLESYLWACP